MDAVDGMLRVVLADDHHFFREGLRELLVADGVAVVGEASDGPGAVRLASELQPDVVVIDLKMPGGSGLQALRQIVRETPASHVAVLTVSSEESDALQALQAGACCYLLKDARTDELVSAVRLAAGGHAVLAREVLPVLVSHVRAANHLAERASGNGLALTARELEVIRLIAEGADNAAIGRELSISRHTVKQYVTNIFEKLGVEGRVQAAVYAVRAGLV